MGFIKDIIKTIFAREIHIEPLQEKKVIKQPEVKPKNFQEQDENTKFSKVRNHLIREGQIDSWTAINLYGATRLSGIIYKLRARGYNIRSIKNSAFDLNNQNSKFTTYKLENGNN